MSEKTFIAFFKSYSISSVPPLWGHVEGLMCCTSVHKPLWEVKIDSLQLWLFTEKYCSSQSCCPRSPFKKTEIISYHLIGTNFLLSYLRTTEVLTI